MIWQIKLMKRMSEVKKFYTVLFTFVQLYFWVLHLFTLKMFAGDIIVHYTGTKHHDTYDARLFVN